MGKSFSLCLEQLSWSGPLSTTSVHFHKKFTGPSFCGGWAKKFQTFIRYFF